MVNDKNVCLKQIDVFKKKKNWIKYIEIFLDLFALIFRDE
jgi:hypothetical protein